MPKPRKGEKMERFVNRCIPRVIEEGKSREQAAGQCYGMWDYAQEKRKRRCKNEGGRRER
jgi:two-component SAPR family response regulator